MVMFCFPFSTSIFSPGMENKISIIAGAFCSHRHQPVLQVNKKDRNIKGSAINRTASSNRRTMGPMMNSGNQIENACCGFWNLNFSI